MLVGIALLAGVRYRVTGDGFRLFDVQLLTRQVSLRTVREDIVAVTFDLVESQRS